MFFQKELENALKSIGYMKNAPSLLDINMELLKHGALNIAMWINFYPFTNAFPLGQAECRGYDGK